MKHAKRAHIRGCGFQLLPGPLILKEGNRTLRHLHMEINLLMRQDEILMVELD